MRRCTTCCRRSRGTVAQAATCITCSATRSRDAAEQVVSDTPIDYVASHGQTVWHDGDAHVTLQLADPFVIRERLNTSICYDFRSADCAANGHGAPLVPYVDALLLASEHEDRVAVNIGGIANLTADAARMYARGGRRIRYRLRATC